MRVLLVSNYALPHIGGIQTLIDEEIRALVVAKHQVVLVTSDGSSPCDSPVYPAEVRVIRVPACHALERRFCIFFPLLSCRHVPLLWQEIHRCDVIHVHGLLFISSVAALLLGHAWGRPLLVTEHLGPYCSESRLAVSMARLWMNTFGRVAARLATRLAAFCPSIICLLEQLAGTRRKSLLLPKPLDRVRFVPGTAEQKESARLKLGFADSRPKVLFVGRLIPDKGVRLLASAANPDYDIVFCGPGDPDIIGSPVAGLHFVPPRPPARLLELYHAADVVVAPSIRDGGIPLAALEALACGVCVVLAEREGLEVYHGSPGLYFCDRSVAGIRSAIRKALFSVERPDPAAISSTLDTLTMSPAEWIARLYGSIEPQCE
jgi:glycosyltransferase involved in cell wall biosynthesis